MLNSEHSKHNEKTIFRCELPEWAALETHAQDVKEVYIRDLFAGDDNTRFENFSLQLAPLLMDFSKQCVTTETIGKLCDYARACDLELWREKMFGGEIINHTEKRAVLHTALRANKNEEVRSTLQKMQGFSDKIRSEKRFTHIVNIGIGGSDLGSFMAYEALKPFTDREISVHFVSNMDSAHLAEVLRLIEAEKTLFIVASKSFTTVDTMTNAHSACEWMREKLGTSDVGEHFAAVTQNVELAKEFGISEDNIFPMWDWVGGRFSLWSAVGLPLVIALGYERFKEMLDGAKTMDEHFASARLEENLPVIMGLIGMWNRNFLGYENLAVIPYNQYMHCFPAYMQQLDMESNGKSVDKNGRRISYATGPVVFGTSGTNAQHSFFQLLHQGTNIVPCEFIACVKPENPMGDHQAKLLANMFAQSKALMEGQDSSDPNKEFDGNRPSTTILLDELTPYNLGMLIALYEHKIFVQGVLWNINSFDQCGVELGKVLAKQIVPAICSEQVVPNIDGSTKNLIEITRKMS